MDPGVIRFKKELHLQARASEKTDRSTLTAPWNSPLNNNNSVPPLARPLNPAALRSAQSSRRIPLVGLRRGLANYFRDEKNLLFGHCPCVRPHRLPEAAETGIRGCRRRRRERHTASTATGRCVILQSQRRERTISAYLL